jgi:hypothetical protein
MFANDQTFHVQTVHKGNNKSTSLTLNLTAQFFLYVPLFQITFFKYIIHALRIILSIYIHHFPIATKTGDFCKRDAVFSVCLELQFDSYTQINFGIHALRIILSIYIHHFPITTNTGDFCNRDAVFSVCLELQFDSYAQIKFGFKDFKHNLFTPS